MMEEWYVDEEYQRDPIDQELWRTISEAPDYEVSNHYRVRRAKSGRPLKYTHPYQGPRVALQVDGKTVSFSVRTLVEREFGPNHIDYDERWRQCERAWNYSVSSNGRIRNDVTGRILRPFKTRSGSLQVTLNDEGHRITIPVQLLVEEAFD